MATVDAKQETNARHVDMTSEEYHAYPAIGSSMLEVFRRSRREYYGRFVSKELDHPAPSDAMELGTLVHMLLLEPERYEETVAFMPEDCNCEPWNMRLKLHRETHQAMLDEYAAIGKKIIEVSLNNKVQSIVKAIRSNWHARRLVESEGQSEFSIFWTDKWTGLELKCRVDWMAAIPLDIKTARDPSPAVFAKAATDLGYFRKYAHYSRGIAHYLGEPVPMVHLVAESDAPYRVAVYDYDDIDNDGRSIGLAQWRDTLDSLSKCYDSNDWREPWEKRIITLRPPGWAFTQDGYLVGD